MEQRAGHLLVLIVQDVNLKEPRLDLFGLVVGWQGFGGWEPHVELCQPVLKSIDLSESQAQRESFKEQAQRAELIQLVSAQEGINPGLFGGLSRAFRNSYRHNGKDRFGWRVAEEDVDEGDHLQSFSQTHAVGQDTAKTTTGLKPLQGLNQVIIQEPDPSNLTRNTHKGQRASKDQGPSFPHSGISQDSANEQTLRQIAGVNSYRNLPEP